MASRRKLKKVKEQDLTNLCKDLEISSVSTLSLRDIPAEQQFLVEEAKDYLPEATSVLVATYCYATERPGSSSRETDDPDSNHPTTDDEPRGEIAPYTWASFYRHLRKKLVKVSKKIGGKCTISVNGRLSEKSWALAAGIGFRGEHSIVITRDFGSLFVIGVLLTSEELPNMVTTSLPEKRCKGCRACIKACPTGALSGGGVIEPQKCIQHMCAIAQPLSEEMMSKWGNRLYGCSTCQDVCPYNRNVAKASHLPQVGSVGPTLPLLPILKMTEEEFRTSVSKNQMARGWVDFRAIKRNALLALASHDSEKGREILISYCNDEDGLLRQTARWVLSVSEA